jgi:hypothetical protein
MEFFGAARIAWTGSAWETVLMLDLEPVLGLDLEPGLRRVLNWVPPIYGFRKFFKEGNGSRRIPTTKQFIACMLSWCDTI